MPSNRNEGPLKASQRESYSGPFDPSSSRDLTTLPRVHSERKLYKIQHTPSFGSKHTDSSC